MEWFKGKVIKWLLGFIGMMVAGGLSFAFVVVNFPNVTVHWPAVERIVRMFVSNLEVQPVGQCSYVYDRFSKKLLDIRCPNDPSDARTRIEALRDQVQLLEKQNRTLETEVKKVPELAAEATRQRALIQESVGLQRKQLDEIAVLRRDLEVKTVEVTTSAQVFAREKAALETQGRSREATIDGLRKQIETSATRLKELEAKANEIPGLQSDIAQLRREIATAADTERNLRADVAKSNGELEAKVKELATSAQAHAREKATLEEQGRTRQEAIDGLRKQIATLEQQRQANEAEAAKVPVLQRELNSKSEELKKESADHYLTTGIYYGEQRKFENSIVSFTKAIELFPDNPKYHYNRGVAFGMHGDDEMAIVDYTTAIRLDGSMADAYTNRALIFRKQGKHAEADADLAVAKKLNLRK